MKVYIGTFDGFFWTIDDKKYILGDNPFDRASIGVEYYILTDLKNISAKVLVPS